MVFKLNLSKLQALLESGEKYYKGYKKLFCYAVRIDEKELNLFLEGKINLKTLQQICKYSSLTLEDFFEEV